jgi:hypothetical protein
MAELDPVLQQAADALKTAHAAGDAENAQKLANYIKNYSPAPVIDTAVEEPVGYLDQIATLPELIPDAVNSFMESFDKRVESARGTRQAVREGRVLPEVGATMNTVALGFGVPIDVIAETIGTGVKGVSLLIPDAVEKPVVNAFATAANTVLSTSAGQLALQALDGGTEDYQRLKKESPETFKAIEAAVNIPLLLGPSVFSKPVSNSIGSAGTRIVNASDKKIAKTKEKFVNDLIKPVQTKKVLEEQLPRTRVEGVLQRAVVELTPDEKEMSTILQNIPSVSYGKTLKHNGIVIRDTIYKKADDLIKKLDKQEKNRIAATGATGRVDVQQVSDRLIKDVQDLIETNPLLKGQKPLQDTANALLNKTLQLLKDKPLTPANVLRVRQDLDKFILKNKGSVFNAADENALSIPFRTIRETLNSVVDEAVPSAGVKKSLREQTLMYRALDNINPKAAEEAATILGRTVQNITKVLPYDSQRGLWLANAAMLGTTAGTALSFPQLIPYMAGGLALTGLGRVTMGTAAPTRVKKLFGQLLQATDKAIKTSKDATMIKQLHADRIYIADALKGLATEEEEGVPELLARP